MAIKNLTEEQVRTWTVEQKDRWWLANVFRGDMPQLTIRSAITGFFLGGVLSATNLYVGARTGWSLGVGITSVILAFGAFKVLSKLGASREFTILENNAMQSIATSAGYMTAPLISSLPAYMIVTGELLPWHTMMLWNISLSILGVLFAFPMKRRFINDEQQPFPEGRACGVVLDTLHSEDARVGVFKAKVLAGAAFLAAGIKFVQAEGIQAWLQFRLFGRHASLVDPVIALNAEKTTLRATLADKAALAPDDLAATESLLLAVRDNYDAAKHAMEEKLLYLPERLDVLIGKFGYQFRKIAGIDPVQLTITPALDVALIGAGGLMGIRAGSSLLIGAILNYAILVPWMIHRKDILPSNPPEGFAEAILNPALLDTMKYGMRQITLWSLWPGVTIMVVASFIVFFAKPKIILSAIAGLFAKKSPDAEKDVLSHIEIPRWVFVVGIPIFSLLAAYLGHEFFDIKYWMSLIGVPLMFILSLIAANSTALTGTTPVGAVSKVTQLTYGAIDPGNIKTNLMTAGMTAEVVSNASNLLMDIKPGYMLGAKPRQQAIGHVIGIFSGALASIPLFYLLFTTTPDFKDKGVAGLQSDKFEMPSVTVWKSVAEVLTKGIDMLAPSVLVAVGLAALLGLVIEVSRILTKGKFPLSSVGLGLAFVINFQSSFAMFLGAFIFWALTKRHAHLSKGDGTPTGHFWNDNHEPICAGLIAGAALMGIADAVVTAFVLPW